MLTARLAHCGPAVERLHLFLPVTVSVIIPVFQAAGHLKKCLHSLSFCVPAPLEVIVVDDGSTDESMQVARESGARVLTTGGRHGPACARNVGAAAAAGDILFFLDADVCVRPETISRLLWRFDERPDADAVIGSYDTEPASRDFLSLYKNLMHAFFHQNAREEACTFWSGCGAVRKKTFDELGGFDVRYERPAIEDIELGYRLKNAGKTIVLDRELQVKHLKRWTFWNLLVTDILNRGIPWTELILRDRRMPNDLNIRFSERVSVALVFLLFLFALEGAIRYGGYFLIPVGSLLLFVLARYWAEAAAQPGGKVALSIITLLSSLFVWQSYQHGMLPVATTVIIGYLLLFLRRQFARGNEQSRIMTGVACAIYLFSAILFTLTFLPARPGVFGFYILLLAVIILNQQFYRFLAARMGPLATMAVLPLHLLYHFYNGLSFAIGVLIHGWRSLWGESRSRTLERGRS